MFAVSSLKRSWVVQKRIIAALLMREILTRYGRHNIGFLWLFVEPMIFTLAVLTLWSATKAIHFSNVPIVAFAITGYSSVLLWRNMPGRTINALYPNLSLLYHRNVRPFDIYLSRGLLEGAGATMSFVILSLIFFSAGLLDPPEDVLKVIWGWTMLAWFGLSLALWVGAMSQNSELIEKIYHPLSYILFPLSGAAFLVDALPAEAQKYLLYVPMVHCVEYIREGYFGSKIVAHHDLNYVAIINLVLTFLGLLEVQRVNRTVTPE